MNDLTKILNQRIAEKITKNQPGPDQLGQKINFDELLQTKKSSVHDMMAELVPDKTTQAVQSLPEIKINLGDIETAAENPTASSPWSKGLDLFSRMNENFNSLEMAVEIASDPNTRISQKNLLALQVGSNQLTQEIEMDAKLIGSGVKALTRIFEMQI